MQLFVYLFECYVPWDLSGVAICLKLREIFSSTWGFSINKRSVEE